MSESSARRRYRAPASNRAWLIGLSDRCDVSEFGLDAAQGSRVAAVLNAAGVTARQNAKAIESLSIVGHATPLAEMRREARTELLAKALVFTSQLAGFRDSTTSAKPDAPLIMTGHQPSLVHPGVWAKNFAASRIADGIQGWSVNLVVDTDLLDARSTRIPAHETDGVNIQSLAFDVPQPAAPWVDADIADMNEFTSFGRRASELMQTEWGIEPLIHSNWADATAGDDRPSVRFTRLRHQQETRWDVNNLEARLSDLSTTTAFRRFFLGIARRADEFLELHNQAVLEYRQLHGLRSQSHPVPLLVRQGDLIELPFWTWRSGETARQPLFVRMHGDHVELATIQETLVRMATGERGQDDAAAIEALEGLTAAGYRIAPRALTTTLFCRVWLCDLFIHGIGGAMYDQMTDRLIQQFYGIEPRPFLVLTGTLHLPISEVPDVSEDDIRRQQRLIRELEYQPERHILDSSQELIAEKAAWVAQEQSRSHLALTRSERRSLRAPNRQRWLRLKEINQHLAAQLVQQSEAARLRLRSLQESWSIKQLLQGREYSAWLFPEEILRDFFGTLLG